MEKNASPREMNEFIGKKSARAQPRVPGDADLNENIYKKQTIPVWVRLKARLRWQKPRENDYQGQNRGQRRVGGERGVDRSLTPKLAFYVGIRRIYIKKKRIKWFYYARLCLNYL